MKRLLPEEERDAVLDHISELAAKREQLPPPPIIFEGNAPADIRDHVELRKALDCRQQIRSNRVGAWLGAPNSIKGSTEALFQRQRDSHLLVVGESVERSIALLAISLISPAAQYPGGGVDFVVLEPHAHESGNAGIFQKLASILPQRIRIGGPDVITTLMEELAEDLKARGPSTGRDAQEVFMIVQDF